MPSREWNSNMKWWNLLSRAAAIGRFPNTGDKSFSTPDEWEDALLILKTAGD